MDGRFDHARALMLILNRERALVTTEAMGPIEEGRFFKSVITIYSEYDPATVELETLARDATSGMSICTNQQATEVTVGELPQEAASFFNVLDEQEVADG